MSIAGGEKNKSVVLNWRALSIMDESLDVVEIFKQNDKTKKSENER